MINYYYSPAYFKLVERENKRVGYEWESLISKPHTQEDVFKLIDKQTERQIKAYEPFKVNEHDR